jgi:hypothetical protein
VLLDRSKVKNYLNRGFPHSVTVVPTLIGDGIPNNYRSSFRFSGTLQLGLGSTCDSLV